MTDEFHPLPIAAVRRETGDAISYALDIPESIAATYRFAPGQNVGVRATVDGAEIRRTYSVSGAPDAPHLWITIKKIQDGQFTSWAHANLKPGQTLDCMIPAGRFTLPATPSDEPARLFAVAAGSGITPVAGLIEAWLARHPKNTATLLFGNRAVDGIIFRERLDALKNRNLERLQIHHILSRDSESDAALLTGRIDADKIRGLTRDCPPAPGDVAFLCGPDSLIKTAREVFLDLGLPREAIRHEFFRAGSPSEQRTQRPRPTTQSPAAGTTEVTAIHDGVRRTFPLAPDQHVIDAALAAGIRLPYSCKGGMCCTCRAKLVEGEVVMDRNFSLQAWEMEAGFVLTCQSRALTPKVVLDYDAM